MSNLGWFILFCVIYKRQICRSFRQRQLLVIFPLIINKKKQKKRKKDRVKQNSKHFCKFLPGILCEFP